MRWCAFCDELLWPDAPDEMVVWKGDPYCNEDHKRRQQLINQRSWKEPMRWSHDCGECGRPMFTPVGKTGWYCPECDREEELDTSYWDWYRKEHFGGSDFDRPCPECDSRIWLFDGSMTCFNDDCDVYISQYSGEWWAMIEQEYPSKTITEQRTLEEA
jgi:DNA-directed RNA polymerase subunit RPC12/RpoP